MTVYDDMQTDELVKLAAVLTPRPRRRVGHELFNVQLVTALVDRLVAYDMVVSELLAGGEPIADYAGQCGCCGMGQPRHGDNWEHLPTCPWLLAEH